MFSGDGQSLLIQRDWEGRDSWWAAKADGSDLRRLALPSLEIQQVLRLCQAEFVGALKDGRIVRFNLQGERTYWTPEGEDARRPDTLMVSSPDEQVFAYVAQSGVVVLRPNEDGLTYARRVQGKMIHGWLGNKALVTGDADALYVTEVSTGQSRKIEYRSLLTKGPRIMTVSVPYVFYPGDEGFVFTDLSRGGKILVYQDGAGRRVDLVQSAEGHHFTGFQWNPRLGARATQRQSQ